MRLYYCVSLVRRSAIAAAIVIGAAALSILFASPAAHASVLKGSFSGIAYHSRIDAEAPWGTNFDGHIVTGRFYFDPYNQQLEWPAFAATSADSSASSSLPPSGSFIPRPGSMELEFFAEGRQVIFGSDGPEGALVRYSTVGDQNLELRPDYFYPYYNATLWLFGALFTNQDFESLNPTNVDLEKSWATFFAGRSFGADVLLTSITFEGTAVPEPPVLALVLVGLSAWALRSRYR